MHSTLESWTKTSQNQQHVLLQYLPSLHYLNWNYNSWRFLCFQECWLLHPATKTTESTNHKKCTQTHTNMSQSMHSFNPIYSLNHSFTRKTKDHCHSSQSSINHALHGPLSMTIAHAHMILHRVPTTILKRDIHTHMYVWGWERQERWWWSSWWWWWWCPCPLPPTHWICWWASSVAVVVVVVVVILTTE